MLGRKDVKFLLSIPRHWWSGRGRTRRLERDLSSLDSLLPLLCLRVFLSSLVPLSHCIFPRPMSPSAHFRACPSLRSFAPFRYLFSPFVWSRCLLAPPLSQLSFGVASRLSSVFFIPVFPIQDSCAGTSRAILNSRLSLGYRCLRQPAILHSCFSLFYHFL